MTPARLALIATAAAGLIAIAAPVFASQIVMGPDGQYYRLVPVEGLHPAKQLYPRRPRRTSPLSRTAG
jgi:hypothetical protein